MARELACNLAARLKRALPEPLRSGASCRGETARARFGAQLLARALEALR